MADSVSSQTIIDAARNTVMKFTNLSDGTGEAAVLKVNPALLNPNPGIHLKIKRIKFNIQNGTVRLQWVATVAADIMILNGYAEEDYTRFGGLTNNGGAGATGGIQFTTEGFGINSSYTITLEMIKGVSLI